MFRNPIGRVRNWLGLKGSTKASAPLAETAPSSAPAAPTGALHVIAEAELAKKKAQWQMYPVPAFHKFSFRDHMSVPSVRDEPAPIVKHQLSPTYVYSKQEQEILKELIDQKKIAENLKDFQKKKLLRSMLVLKKKSESATNVLTSRMRALKLPPHWCPKNLESIPKRGPVRHLTAAIRKTGGRNNTGRITTRHRGGGFKQRARLLDTNRDSTNKQRVVRLEYDPTRSARLALLQDTCTNKLSYALATQNMKEGTVLDPAKKEEGITKSLKEINPGAIVHNVEEKPGKGGSLVRSAGTGATVVGFDQSGAFCMLKLPSGKIKTVNAKCKATIGKVGNEDWRNRVIGKAGRNRNLGWRPSVRGVAMNPVDHPHGGGSGGKSKGHHSQSPWGWVCK